MEKVGGWPVRLAVASKSMYQPSGSLFVSG